MSGPLGRGRRRWLALVVLVVLAEALGIALCAAGYYTHGSAMRELGSWGIMIGAFLAMAGSAARARARRAQSAGGEVRPPAAGRSSRLARTVGIGLVLLGLALLAATPLSWGIRLFGLVVAIGGVLSVRNSFDRSAVAPSDGSGDKYPHRAVGRFDRVMAITGAALVPAIAFSAAALFLTPPAGHRAWPVYAFSAVALACILVWAYLFGRFLVWLAVAGWGRR